MDRTSAYVCSGKTGGVIAVFITRLLFGLRNRLWYIDMVARTTTHRAGSLLRATLGVTSPSRIASSFCRGVATSSRTANIGTGRAILGLGALALPVSWFPVKSLLRLTNSRHTSTITVCTSIRQVAHRYWTKRPPMIFIQLIPIDHKLLPHPVITVGERKVRSRLVMYSPRRRVTKSG